MDFRDTVSGELPAPRDEEPARLRRDILDELADHLACSYNRELLRGANPPEARRRAIERFGDPAAVARRLWLDAMKGKIMTRRIVIATCLLVTLGSLSLAGVVWRQTARAQRESARAVAEAVRLMADQNEKAQAGQRALLEQLQEMSETIRSTRSLDWNPVTFQVNEETPDGPPVAGVSISLSGTGGQSGTELAARVTGRSGIADLGVVHPGHYLFRMIRRWDRGSASTQGSFKIDPGSRIRKRITCPRLPPERVPIRVRWAWPDDLAKEKPALYASFVLDPTRRDDLSWTLSDDWPSDPATGPGRVLRMPFLGSQWPATRSVLCGPGPSLTPITPSPQPISQPYLWQPSGDSSSKCWAELKGSDLGRTRESTQPIEWEQGTYRLSRVLVLRPDEPADSGTGRRRFELVGASLPAPGGGLANTLVWYEPPVDDGAGDPRPKASPVTRGAGMNAPANRPSHLFEEYGPRRADLIVPADSWPGGAESFDARPGQVNEWTIRLPDELFEAVRRRLKADASTQAAPIGDDDQRAGRRGRGGRS